jgi:hypothetical protein
MITVKNGDMEKITYFKLYNDLRSRNITQIDDSFQYTIRLLH